MPKTILKLLLGAMLLMAIQACAPGIATSDPTSINTAIAQTVAALTETSGPGIPITGDASPTATQTPTLTQELPSPTPTETLIPTPIIISSPATPQLSVSVPTNCRVGPGRDYERVGALLVGEVADVVGRNAAGDYWIIRNPDRPNQTCWLWGRYASLGGNTSALPVFTPPPGPTPTSTPMPTANLAASFDGLESCTATGWWVDIELENTGGVTFESMSLIVIDTATNTVLPLDSDDFTDRDGCNETDTRVNLPSGATRIVSSPVFGHNPTGHALRATITVCSNPGLNGICRTQVIQFTP